MENPFVATFIVPKDHGVNRYLEPAGRTVRVEELMMQIYDYFLARPMIEETRASRKVMDGEGDFSIVEYTEQKTNPVPLWSEFCRATGISKRELLQAGRGYAPLLRIIAHADEAVKDYLTRGGLMKMYDPTFAKFVATNLTDMEDKSTRKIVTEDSIEAALDDLEESTTFIEEGTDVFPISRLLPGREAADDPVPRKTRILPEQSVHEEPQKAPVLADDYY